MKSPLIFATNNLHKVGEVQNILAGSGMRVLSLDEAGFKGIQLAETGDTLVANAIEKALQLHHLIEADCFAEDAGLEVDALDGAPGVYTHRFAGEHATAAMNNEKLIRTLQGKPDRTARFRTFIALIYRNAVYLFEGVVEGKIAETPSGSGGFGYDPIFIPDGYTQSFAELPPAVKHTLSHRAKAVRQMQQFLEKIQRAEFQK